MLRIFKKGIRISDKEYNLIIEELISRLKDMIYGDNCKSRLKKQHPKERFEQWINENDTKTDIEYKFIICSGDLIQILNRIRRGK